MYIEKSGNERVSTNASSCLFVAPGKLKFQREMIDE
jgi:hypothetical protein